ncbi:MAG TPA: sensor histidine kinase, partial [Clostridia bacterium]|nr:sensor histidine kinase [Clostridia bacterium]
MRDGLRPSMAQILEFNPQTKALTIIDDDLEGHAEWHTLKDYAPPVAPGDQLLLTWHEAYSFGLGGVAQVTYTDLPAGYFRFLVNHLSLSGQPSQPETSLAFEIPQAFWKTPWFWVSLLTAAAGFTAGLWRYLTWRRFQTALQLLEQQRAIERERLRIAQDIHDDLGARVTQISLLSAVAQRKPSLSDEARADFGTVSQMTRDLVSALYETVWAVNPENDNLEAFGNFLCQLGNQLCTPARLRCRLEVPELPSNVPLTSQVRHNLIMAAKEALHNIIKHARASEARLRITYQNAILEITIEDDGCGFNPAAITPGHGLENLRRRLATIGGDFTLQSHPQTGTTIRLRLPIHS